MSDFLDIEKATPDVLLRESGALTRESRGLAARADAGQDRLAAERAPELERRKTERTADSDLYKKGLGDLQEATLATPHTAMPNPDLGPPLDPEKTQGLAFALIAMSLVGAAAGKKHWGMATAALDGMLKGFKEGSEEAIAENKAKFDREFRTAKEKQAEAVSVYQSVLKSKELSLNAIAETIRVHAAANHDWEMEQAARAKDFDKMYGRVDRMRTAADRLQQQATVLQDRIDARAEKRADKAKAQDSGTELSERYSTDPSYKKSVDYWAGLVQKGVSLPPRFAQSGAGKKMMPDILLVVPTIGSGNSGDLIANKLNQREMTAEAQKIGTQAASVAIANKELARFIPPAIKAMDDVPRAGWRPINQIMQAAENTWSPEQGKLVLANRAVLNAFAQLIQRGAPTVHSLTEAENLLNTADSKAVYKAKLEQLTLEGVQAEAGLQDARDDLMKRARNTGTEAGGGGSPAPYADADKEARYQKWKAEHGGP